MAGGYQGGVIKTVVRALGAAALAVLSTLHTVPAAAAVEPSYTLPLAEAVTAIPVAAEDRTGYNREQSCRLAETPAMPGRKTAIATRLLGGRHNLQHALAVVNSSSDLELLACVAWPLAFEPDSKLRAAATRQGWRIVNRSSILTHIPLPKKNEGLSQE